MPVVPKGARFPDETIRNLPLWDDRSVTVPSLIVSMPLIPHGSL